MTFGHRARRSGSGSGTTPSGFTIPAGGTRPGLQLRPVRLRAGELPAPVRPGADVVLDGRASRRTGTCASTSGTTGRSGCRSSSRHAGRRRELQPFLRVERAARAPLLPLRLLPRQLLDPRARRASTACSAARIRAATAEPCPPAPRYRFHTQRLTANDPPIFTGLLLALGQGVDRPISAWEEMFLPLKMREHVRARDGRRAGRRAPAAGPIRAHALRVVGTAAARRRRPTGCRGIWRWAGSSAARRWLLARRARGKARRRASGFCVIVLGWAAAGRAGGPGAGGTLGVHRPRDGLLGTRTCCQVESAGVAAAAGLVVGAVRGRARGATGGPAAVALAGLSVLGLVLKAAAGARSGERAGHRARAAGPPGDRRAALPPPWR